MDFAGYVDGAFVKGDGPAFTVENPSDETVIAEVTGASPARFDAAIAAARRSFDSGAWSGMTATQRAETLRRYGNALKARAERLRDLAIAEAG